MKCKIIRKEGSCRTIPGMLTVEKKRPVIMNQIMAISKAIDLIITKTNRLFSKSHWNHIIHKR